MRLFIIILLACSLTACTNLGKKLGVGVNKKPDEFRVTKHAPLEVPAGLTLPVPQPGVPRPQETTPQQDAQKVLFSSSTADDGVSNEETSTSPASTSRDFLSKLGADNVNPNIRQEIDADYQARKNEDVPIGIKLLRLGEDVDPKAEIVDPEAERQRIQKNIEENKSITEGETPQNTD